MKRTTLLFSLLFSAACGGGGGSDTDAGPTDCEPGQAGCACIDGTTCMGALMCQDSLCVQVDTTGLQVTDQGARACEVILVESDLEVVDVQFGTGVQGTFIREAPRVSVTFHANADEAFQSNAVNVMTTGGVAGTLNLRRPRCFDSDGNVLSGDPLTLGE